METIDFNEVIRDPETISAVGALLPTATYNSKGIVSFATYRNIPQKINIGKEYNAIRIADNLGKWIRHSIPFFGYIPSGKKLAFHGFVFFDTTDVKLNGGAKILSQGDNSEGLLALYAKQENDKFHVYLVAPMPVSSEVDTFFITSPYECVRKKLILDDSYKKLQIDIIGG